MRADRDLMEARLATFIALRRKRGGLSFLQHLHVCEEDLVRDLSSQSRARLIRCTRVARFELSSI